MGVAPRIRDIRGSVERRQAGMAAKRDPRRESGEEAKKEREEPKTLRIKKLKNQRVQFRDCKNIPLHLKIVPVQL